MQKMYITTGFLIDGLHYIFKTGINMYQSLLWYKTVCHVKLISDFSQVLMNFRKVWSSDPDYKCKYRNSKNKAQ